MIFGEIWLEGQGFRQGMSRRITTVSSTADRLREELEEALAHPNEIFGYARYGDGKTWHNIDRITGGIQRKSFDVLASRPKYGKSMLAAGWLPSIGYQALQEEMVLRVVTLEMTAASYLRRAGAILAGINDPLNIRRGFLTLDEQKRYTGALKTLSSLPIEFLSNETDMTEEEALGRASDGTYVREGVGVSSVTYADVDRFIRGEAGTGETFWWLLDHIGLLSDVSPEGDVTRAIWLMANKLSILAHQVATGLVITHLNRSSVSDGTPSIESIAGSDQVGRNADYIFLLDRPYQHPKVSPEERDAVKDAEPAYLIVYSRDAGTGLDMLLWDVHKASFTEMELEDGVEIPLPGKKKK